MIIARLNMINKKSMETYITNVKHLWKCISVNSFIFTENFV